MEASAIANTAQIPESLDPRLATIIAVALIVLILIISIASVLISVFSYSLIVFVGTCLFAAAGFLASLHSHPAAIPVGIGLQLGGLLLAIGGVQSHRRSVAILFALEQLSDVVAPSIVPHEQGMVSRSVGARTSLIMRRFTDPSGLRSGERP
jgi:hypothetical protein